MPNKNKGEDIYKFKNWKRRMPVPYYFTADFECFTPENDNVDKTNKTKKVQTHIPNSYKFIKIRYDGVSEPPRRYMGEDADKRFVSDIIKEAYKIRAEYKNPVKYIEAPGDKENFKKATHCWICEKAFKENSCYDAEKKVLDHCHITGKYRGPAHNGCNLELHIKPEQILIPVLFHNLSGYDSHIIMRGLGALECQDDINLIPYNMEKYMAFNLGPLRFLDSMQFCKSSLSALAENLGAVSCKKQDCTEKSHLWKIDVLLTQNVLK